MLAFAISSKLTIMTLDETYYLGDFIEDNGWIFSNNSYQVKPAKIKNFGFNGNYDLPSSYSNKGWNQKYGRLKSTGVLNVNKKPSAVTFDKCDWCEEQVPSHQLRSDPTLNEYWLACETCYTKSTQADKENQKNSLISSPTLYNGQDWH